MNLLRALNIILISTTILFGFQFLVFPEETGLRDMPPIHPGEFLQGDKPRETVSTEPIKALTNPITPFRRYIERVRANPDVALVGIFSDAAILELPGRVQVVAYPGEAIAATELSGWTLGKIGPDWVILKSGANVIPLRMKQEKSRPRIARISRMGHCSPGRQGWLEYGAAGSLEVKSGRCFFSRNWRNSWFS